MKKPEEAPAQTLEERTTALIAAGKLLPAEKAEPVKPFKPVRVKGKPVSRVIIEDRR